jgi:hypothetical protein
MQFIGQVDGMTAMEPATNGIRRDLPNRRDVGVIDVLIALTSHS